MMQIIGTQFAGLFEIEEVENGRIAIEACRIFYPDIVMMDIKMPLRKCSYLC